MLAVQFDSYDVAPAFAATALLSFKFDGRPMKVGNTIFAAVALFLFSVSFWGQTANVHGTANAVDEHYNHLKSFKAEFTEVYQGDGISRTESGTLWLKKPGRMRWEYRVPREKLFLIDSQTAYFYVTGDRQAKKTPAKNQ